MDNQEKSVSPKIVQERLNHLRKKFGIKIGFSHTNDLPNLDLYRFKENDHIVEHTSRYFRNFKTLQRINAIFYRIQPLYVSLDYFDGNISIEGKKDLKLSPILLEIMMTSIMVDTFRSLLDIFSVMVSIYYDLPNPENVSFSYNKFVNPIKEFSREISIKSNELYKLLDKSEVKDFRDTEKHLGFTPHKISIEQSFEKKKSKISIQRVERIDLMKIRDEVEILLDCFINLLELSVDEMCTHPLGYISKNDINPIINSDGTYIIPD